MKEIILEGLYTEFAAVQQVQDRIRSSLPVRVGKEQLANPVECKLVVLPLKGKQLTIEEGKKAIALLVKIAKAKPSDMQDLKNEVTKFIDNWEP